jgi:hypothetical protein
MNRTEILLLGMVALVGITFLSKANAAGGLIFSPGFVSGITLDGITPIITFTILAQNTSSSGFTLQSLAGNLTCDDYYVGNLSSFVPVPVSGNSQTTIPVQVRLQPLGIVNDIIKSFQTNNFTKKVVFTGFANAGFIRVPLKLEFTIGE